MSAAAVNPERRIQTVCLLVLAGIAMAGALYWLKPAVIPFIVAMLLAYALAPLIDLLALKARFPHWLAIVTALLLGFGLFTLLAGMISGSVNKLAANADTYQQQLAALGAQVTTWLAALGVDVSPDALQGHLSKIPVGSLLVQLTNTVVDLLSNTFLVLIFAIYLLQGRQPGAQAAGAVRDAVDQRIKRYLGIKVALSAVTGVLTAIILAVLGVDLALVFGLLAFLLNFIPSVGSLIAIVLPIPVVLLDPGAGWITLTLAVALPGAVQMTIGNVLEPKYMGESLDLHPITVLLTLILWGMLWGVIGMVLATPITAVLKILFAEFEITKPVAELMAGRLGRSVAPSEPEGA